MAVFNEVKAEDLYLFLKKNKYIELRIKTIHEQLRYSKGIKNKVLVILYNSGKLLLQGGQVPVERTKQQLISAGIGKEIKPIKFRKELGWVIGSDESMKGDTFGGLIVAGVKADEKIREKLLELGVADSKALSDKEIPRLAEEIKKIAGCQIISLSPEEYNETGRVTVLLNKLHKDCANYLGNGTHVVDKYPGCSVGDIKETKAEQKYLEVAAASILARNATLQQFNYLSKKAGFPVPKGSTHVKWGLQELKEKGLKFDEFVKVSFNNVKVFLEGD
jgi:ribonuclease HIII